MGRAIGRTLAVIAPNRYQLPSCRKRKVLHQICFAFTTRTVYRVAAVNHLSHAYLYPLEGGKEEEVQNVALVDSSLQSTDEMERKHILDIGLG